MTRAMTHVFLTGVGPVPEELSNPAT
jgi:hypothetical protein